jgi:hypothetical protein
LAFTVKPRKSGIDALIWLALRFHQPRNASPYGSSCWLVSVSGANRLSVGAVYWTDSASLMPYGRSASASAASWAMYAIVR